MRRMTIGLAAVFTIVTLVPAGVTASEPTVRGPKLINAYQRALLGTTNSDPWLFDDGCIGGTSKHDPAFMLVPLTDPNTPESACTISRKAPLLIVSDGFTCVQPTLVEAREECETEWVDPAIALVSNSIIVDGKPRTPKRTRVSGDFTFPIDAALDEPGKRVVYYGITDAVVLDDLDAGTHTVFVAYRYADGLNGATTFTLTVTR